MAGDRNNKAIAWLYSQFSSLIENGVITKTTAEKLREHYGEVIQTKKISGMAIFSIIGSTLVALGILLVIAFNWSNIARPGKIALSFLPIFTGMTPYINSSMSIKGKGQRTSGTPLTGFFIMKK